MDAIQVKDMLKRYTQEYALDEPTRLRAEELYKEYMKSNQKPNIHMLMVSKASKTVISGGLSTPDQKLWYLRYQRSVRK